MSHPKSSAPLKRRSVFLGGAGLLALTRMSGLAAAADAKPAQVVSFYGPHQAGIVTPVQRQTSFAAFDLVTKNRADVIDLLKKWTEAAARMSVGKPAVDPSKVSDADDYVVRGDGGDAAGLSTANLTITFGFGTTLFTKDGIDRYGLAARRPEAFVDMPKFPGDQLVAERSDGDLSVQACADDPQVTLHVVRELAKLAEGVADLRWAQNGFNGGYGEGETPRNLMGFKDGTNNPPIQSAKDMDAVVWVGNEGPKWIQGGSYVVYRRARIAVEHWDHMKQSFQEETFGRHKVSGAPLGKTHEHDNPDYDATDKDGNPVVPENSHMRLASAENNDGARILRRAFSYDDGASFTAERWPPWRQGVKFDAGLLFICYQRDPRTGFIKLFEKMAKFDMMNQFVTNTASAMFAVPHGVSPGGYIGKELFEG